MRTALLGLRGLVFLRRFFVFVLFGVFGPVVRFVKFLGRKTFVAGFRLTHSIKRSSKGVTRHAEKRLLYLFSGRWMVHASLVAVAVIVGVVNVSQGEVRAEGFGERSLLFRLANSQLAPALEEVTSEQVRKDREIPDYFETGLVSGVFGGTDTHSMYDSYVTTTVGGAVSAPGVVESKPSVAPRTSVETYAVQSGDTLGGIAEQYGLSLNTLLWANGLSFRSTLKIGQTLTIPPVDGVIHTVKKGDTLLAIAKKYNVETSAILEYNHMSSANALAIGDDLVVPGGQVVAAAPVRTVASVGSVFTSTPSVTPSRTALPSGSGAWVWPTDLRSITQYFGWRHTGIDIDCNGHSSSTNTNYAAADGVVVYSGWRNGYGSTVEINHGNGLMTRYGHHAKLYVTTGQIVTAGTPVGLCGTSGRSTGTHLHFEVILGGRFVNPLEYVR